MMEGRKRDNTYYLELGIDIGVAITLREVLTVLDRDGCVKMAECIGRARVSHALDHPEAMKLISQSGRN